MDDPDRVDFSNDPDDPNQRRANQLVEMVMDAMRYGQTDKLIDELEAMVAITHQFELGFGEEGDHALSLCVGMLRDVMLIQSFVIVELVEQHVVGPPPPEAEDGE